MTLLTNKSVTCSLQMMNQETSSGCYNLGLCQKVMFRSTLIIKTEKNETCGPMDEQFNLMQYHLLLDNNDYSMNARISQ